MHNILDEMLKRTKNCGELRAENAGEEVVLNGWVSSIRDHGGLIFIDLRDRYGITQIVFSEDLVKEAEKLHPEYVIAVRGTCQRRPQGTENLKIPTGEVEVVAEGLEVLNVAKTAPIPVNDDQSLPGFETRLRYRYLDLRRTLMQRNLITRHKLFSKIRQYLDERGFVDIETPFLTKSTPEGARDFLVPSRLNPGTFYALPQSPQLFKQILMVSGFDRYYQIVRCFRDEDLRADRQPEFTQLDLEMSFVEEDDVLELVEGLMAFVMKEVLGREVELPFPRLDYEDALNTYGTDKPDLRFGMELSDLGELCRQSQFKVFLSALEMGGVVKGICVRGGASFSRHTLDELTGVAQELGAGGLAWLKRDGGWSSPISKFFPDPTLDALGQRLRVSEGDLVLIVADQWEKACTVLGEIRVRLARDLRIIPQDEFKYCWVVDFPLLEWSEEEKRYVSRHHPFTSPRPEDLELLEAEPEKVKARAYDLVLNGSEIGGGSIRIHRRDIQERVFRVLGIEEEEARKKFAFLLEALEYGAPPHGGIALGLDRIVALFLGLETIREVIAFPKTQKALCLMTSAPSAVDQKQLRELHIRLTTEE